jgi:hypothetical protein
MKTTKHMALALGALSVAASVSAHDSHGLTGSHWHATDAYGFVLVAVLAALAIWFSRGE